jgi:hypothetical protein
MTMQRLCHAHMSIALATIVLLATSVVHSDPLQNDYPTVARVEYVNECINNSGGKLAALYQCSCVIDRIAQQLSFDQYVEASTYSKYATLPGEAGGLFRDPEEGRKLAKLFQETEIAARKECGLSSREA